MEGMGELRWSDVREWFDPEDAPLHDGCVVGVVPGAWRAVGEFVRARGWPIKETEGLFFEADEEVVFDGEVALTFEGCDPTKMPYLHYDPVTDGFVLDRAP